MTTNAASTISQFGQDLATDGYTIVANPGAPRATRDDDGSLWIQFDDVALRIVDPDGLSAEVTRAKNAPDPDDEVATA